MQVSNEWLADSVVGENAHLLAERRSNRHNNSADRWVTEGGGVIGGGGVRGSYTYSCSVISEYRSV